MKIDRRPAASASCPSARTRNWLWTFYAQEAIRYRRFSYLMTLLNSTSRSGAAQIGPADERFPVYHKKMSGSGALFDIEKLRDVSKNVISRMTAEQVYDYVAEWSAVNDGNLTHC